MRRVASAEYPDERSRRSRRTGATLSYPTLRDLVRVIPVAQSQTCGDTTSHSSRLTAMRMAGSAISVSPCRPTLLPGLLVHPAYNANRARQFGGSGGFFSWHHREGDRTGTLSVIMHPALDPDEPDIEFSVPTIHFSDRTPIAWGVLMAETQGPWRFRLTQRVAKPQGRPGSRTKRAGEANAGAGAATASDA